MMTHRRVQYVEAAGLLAVLVSLGAYLWKTYSLKAYSDPAQWYYFGRNFSSLFGGSGLAYGFPATVAGAIKVCGPFSAFLINIPLLMLLVAAMYSFAKWHCHSERDDGMKSGMLCGAITVLIFIALNKDMLRYLSSPYRDPLSWLLLLCSCLLLFRFRHRARHSLWLAAGSGACLAAACSVRETSVLMLPPLLLYAVSEKFRDRSVPFWKPLGAVVLVFVLCCIPFLVQNYLRTGDVLIPSQAAKVVAKGGSVVPGIQTRHIGKVFPKTLSFLFQHYGGFLCAAFAVGVVAAIVTKRCIVLCVSAAAVLIYICFYGAYTKVVPRYLFVIEMFSVPVMGYGIASIVSAGLALSKVRWRRDVRVQVVGSSVVFLAAVLVTLRGWSAPEERFRLPDARKLSSALNATIHVEEDVVSERPLHGFLKCFSHSRSQGMRSFGKRRTLRDPTAVDALMRMVDESESESVRFAYHSQAYAAFMQSEFDLVDDCAFVTEEYGLGGLIGEETFHVSRIVPWSKTTSQKSVVVEGAGAYTLAVDVGRLSKLKREFVSVSVNGRVVDKAPLDGFNYYHVVVTGMQERVSVALASDAPVPDGFSVCLMPSEAPIVMKLKGDAILPYRSRFSKEFCGNPGDRYPEIKDVGQTLVPTMAGQNVLFLVAADVTRAGSAGDCSVSVGLDGRQLFHGPLGPGWRQVSFPLPGRLVTGNNTRLEWKLESQADSGPMYLVMRQLVVQRIECGKRFEVMIGGDRDKLAIIDGMHARESVQGDPSTHWRWTKGRARVRMVVDKGENPVRIAVMYFDANRPDAVGPTPTPDFRVNGTKVESRLSFCNVGGMKAVEASLEVPAHVVQDEISILELVVPTWIPADHGIGADKRELGVMLHSVSAVRGQN